MRNLGVVMICDQPGDDPGELEPLRKVRPWPHVEDAMPGAITDPQSEFVALADRTPALIAVSSFL